MNPKKPENPENPETSENFEATENPVAHQLFAALRQLRKSHWQHSVEGHKPSEMTLLITIARRGHSTKEGLKVSEISRFLGLTPPTVTQLINSLEAKNMVARQADPKDRRVVRITLTEQGKAVTRKAKGYMDVMLNKLVEYLGEDESILLAELLLKMHAFIEDNPPPNLDRLQMNGDEKL
ncbi:MarR family winged helix-turn-helix transcriptional regulator [Paenibacillus monticola]|uniref:MarR family transcriptional regulator n=1 Tax=Paenibacillus monticola TaxID=2666075 RepID=A0A7X2H675_9BACL|nr:MarR family transcriptional regulator [Paenibacillus monticola]MRN54180.1 MarR family transcriptional regulator [Paenibacillus monticola]